MRKVYVAFFKLDTGKFYISEEQEFDSKLSVDEIKTQVNEIYSNRYKNMIIGITFDPNDEIGYPCLILPENRMQKRED